MIVFCEIFLGYNKKQIRSSEIFASPPNKPDKLFNMIWAYYIKQYKQLHENVCMRRII